MTLQRSIKMHAKGEKIMEKIVLSWEVKSIEDASRVAAMYCFKSCTANQN